MTDIKQGANIETLINTFTTTEETQQQVLELLIETTEEHISQLPGFISANFHKSPDGKNVVNYAQWESAEAWQAMLDAPAASAHIGEVLKLATANFNLYEVVATIAPKH